eukprot:3990422-Prymnesium_polylepis.1
MGRSGHVERHVTPGKRCKRFGVTPSYKMDFRRLATPRAARESSGRPETPQLSGTLSSVP